MVRAAEECAATLASYIPPIQSIRILIPIVQTAQMPINLAAIKMQTKVVEQMSAEELTPVLPEAIPGLLKVSFSALLRDELNLRNASISYHYWQI